MNQTSVVIFGLLMAATFIGAANFHDVAKQYHAHFSSEKSKDMSRCLASIEDEKMIIGHTETIWLGEEKTLKFDAKVDSGADTSSLHATEIVPFTRVEEENGEKKELLYVRFKTSDDLGSSRQLERMVSRVDQVRSATGTSKRYFFKERIWINEDSFEIEINLADRTQLTKKMLLGKNLLNRGYLIDTNQSFIITKANGRLFTP